MTEGIVASIFKNRQGASNSTLKPSRGKPIPKTGSRRGFKVLDRELVSIHSQFTRLSEADSNGYLRCFTCGCRMFWRDAEEGHYISRTNLIVKFDDRNTHPQCWRCNHELKGNTEVYRVKLVVRYGEAVVSALEALSKTKFKPDSEWYNRLRFDYSRKLKILTKKIRFCR